MNAHHPLQASSPLISHTSNTRTFTQAHTHECSPPFLQASSPSTERRVLVAEQLHALLNPGEPCALVDLAVTAHTLLPQLHRLAEDRMEQVGVCGGGGTLYV